MNIDLVYYMYTIDNVRHRVKTAKTGVEQINYKYHNNREVSVYLFKNVPAIYAK